MLYALLISQNKHHGRLIVVAAVHITRYVEGNEIHHISTIHVPRGNTWSSSCNEAVKIKAPCISINHQLIPLS
jgi:hypothetical protein